MKENYLQQQSIDQKLKVHIIVIVSCDISVSCFCMYRTCFIKIRNGTKFL